MQMLNLLASARVLEVYSSEYKTERIENGTMVVHFNYTFTPNQQNDIDFTSTWLKFRNNGTVILK
jgi:hypothetical protein